MPATDLSARANFLSKAQLDSTEKAEKAVKETKESDKNPSTIEGTAMALASSVNYARQASVSAQSTYPGYSALKIQDGSRTTTVGPSYSWANNYPDGTRLPQSVYLKFGSLKRVNQIDIYTSSGYELQNYTILYRVTPTGTWNQILAVTGNRSTYRSHVFSNVDLLEIQIVCQLGPPNQTIYGRLNEVEVYGPVEPTLPYIQNQNGILAFNSSSDVEQAIAYLEYKYDQYSDAFASQYPGLTADQFADLEESVGFNDHKPFIDFENMYGIYSLRAILLAQEEYWLASTAGDATAGTDPDDSYMGDYETRTLVNSDGYIKIGTSYYVFLSDGSYYTYDAGSGGGCATGCPIQLASIKKLKPYDPLPNGVKYFQSTQSVSTYLLAPDCQRNAHKGDKISNGDNTWRFKWKVTAHDGPFPGPGKVKAFTKSYRRKNGRWNVRGALIGAQVWGTVVSQDCTGGGPIDSPYESGRKRKKTAKVSVSNLAVRKGDIFGYHYHEKVGSYNSNLTW